MPARQMTDRVLEALRNPYVRCLSHPTGRYINRRPENALDLDRVFEVALEHDVALEINGLPIRLDLSAEHVRDAIRAGITLVCSTDAHSHRGAGEHAVRGRDGPPRRGDARRHPQHAARDVALAAMELLEREEHLAMLETWLAEVRESGRGQMVLLAGEAGGGKTALVSAFAARQRSVAVLAGGCEPLFTPRPLGPLQDIGLADLTPSAGEAVVAMGRALRGTSIVVLEDLHWADEATLDFVQLLGRRVAGMPALVIATYRDDELARDHPLRVVLGQLTARAPDARRAAVGGRGGAAGHVTRRRRHGAPRSHRGQSVLRDRGTRARRCQHARERPRCRGRARGAPARARPRLLEAVAIARPRAEIELLERIAPDELPELEACLASGMLRADGDAVVFRHEIARATIEDELPPDRRIGLHRAALAALAGGEPARLAHHAEAADDGAAVLEYSQAAGERAARLGAHREAAAHFAAALRHADGLEPAARAALLERRAQECFVSGMIEEAVDAETLALEIFVATGDRLREGDAHRQLALFAWYQGDGARNDERTDTAVAILETVSPGRELALAYGARASRSMMAFDLAGAREWGDKAIELAERLNETEVLVTAIGIVGTVELAHGLDEGREKLQRALALALDAGLERHAAVVYCNLVNSLPRHPRLRGGRAHLDAGRAYCDQHDLLAWDIYLGGWEARIALDHGRWAEAGALAVDNVERTHGTLPHSRFRSLLVAGVLHARRGDADPWPQLDEALAIAAAANELDTVGPVAAARAEARWLAGEDRWSPWSPPTRSSVRSAPTIAG